MQKPIKSSKKQSIHNHIKVWLTEMFGIAIVFNDSNKTLGLGLQGSIKHLVFANENESN